MSYEIRYDSGVAIKHIEQQKPQSLIIKLVLTFSLVLILSIALFGKQNVIDFFIPGNPEETKTAWTEMVNELESGSNIGQALTVFCQSVINNEKME